MVPNAPNDARYLLRLPGWMLDGLRERAASEPDMDVARLIRLAIRERFFTPSLGMIAHSDGTNHPTKHGA